MCMFLINKWRIVQCHKIINLNVLFIIIHLFTKWKDIILQLNYFLNLMKNYHLILRKVIK
jgi:hypothetical protein